MAHVLLELELMRDRQRRQLAAAADQREARRARMHGRIARQVARAELRTASQASQARRLRARLAEIELGL